MMIPPDGRNIWHSMQTELLNCLDGHPKSISMFFCSDLALLTISLTTRPSLNSSESCITSTFQHGYNGRTCKSKPSCFPSHQRYLPISLTFLTLLAFIRGSFQTRSQRRLQTLTDSHGPDTLQPLHQPCRHLLHRLGRPGRVVHPESGVPSDWENPTFQPTRPPRGVRYDIHILPRKHART